MADIVADTAASLYFVRPAYLVNVKKLKINHKRSYTAASDKVQRL